MKTQINPEALKQVFTEARSFHAWLDKPVTDAQLRELYEVFKWGPTSVNLAPARMIFIRTEESRAKLYPYLMDSNVEQVRTAPVTVIIAQDEEFYEKGPQLFPAYDARSYFKADLAVAHEHAFRNASLQGAYMMLAARALGFDVCPLSGFENAKVDEVFLAGTKWKSNFLCTLGYGDAKGLYPRGPRLSFEEACRFE